jgi:hypothetical protein
MSIGVARRELDVADFLDLMPELFQ